MAIVALLGLLPTGCATLTGSASRDEEQLLAAAGFQLKLADTKAKHDQLAALPQHQLFPERGPDGKPRFVYADARSCDCMYVGTEAAYQRYQRLALRERLSQERLMAAEEMQNATLDWDLWGPWYPWY